MTSTVPAIRRVAAACLVAIAPLVWAHAVLDKATPAARSTVRDPPARVTLRFSERLEPAFSKLQVLDARGRRVDNDDASVTGNDGSVISVSLRTLSPGVYTVKWRVLSVDSHVTEGDFTFNVAEQ